MFNVLGYCIKGKKKLLKSVYEILEWYLGKYEQIKQVCNVSHFDLFFIKMTKFQVSIDPSKNTTIYLSLLHKTAKQSGIKALTELLKQVHPSPSSWIIILVELKYSPLVLGSSWLFSGLWNISSKILIGVTLFRSKPCDWNMKRLPRWAGDTWAEVFIKKRDTYAVGVLEFRVCGDEAQITEAQRMTGVL